MTGQATLEKRKQGLSVGTSKAELVLWLSCLVSPMIWTYIEIFTLKKRLHKYLFHKLSIMKFLTLLHCKTWADLNLVDTYLK